MDNKQTYTIEQIKQDKPKESSTSGKKLGSLTNMKRNKRVRLIIPVGVSGTGSSTYVRNLRDTIKKEIADGANKKIYVFGQARDSVRQGKLGESISTFIKNRSPMLYVYDQYMRFIMSIIHTQQILEKAGDEEVVIIYDFMFPAFFGHPKHCIFNNRILCRQRSEEEMKRLGTKDSRSADTFTFSFSEFMKDAEIHYINRNFSDVKDTSIYHSFNIYECIAEAEECMRELKKLGVIYKDDSNIYNVYNELGKSFVNDPRTMRKQFTALEKWKIFYYKMLIRLGKIFTAPSYHFNEQEAQEIHEASHQPLPQK